MDGVADAVMMSSGISVRIGEEGRECSIRPPKTGEFSIGHAVASKADVDALLAEAAGATVTD
jgi:hypothetical protein